MYSIAVQRINLLISFVLSISSTAKLIFHCLRDVMKFYIHNYVWSTYQFITVTSTSSTLHIYHMNKLLYRCRQFMHCPPSFRNESNIPIRTELFSQFQHVIFRHVLEFPAPLGFEFIHISADECGTSSSINNQQPTRNVKEESHRHTGHPNPPSKRHPSSSTQNTKTSPRTNDLIRARQWASP